MNVQVRLITSSSTREGAQDLNCLVDVNVLGSSGFKFGSRKQHAWMLSVVFGTKTQSNKLLTEHRTDVLNLLRMKKFFILLTGDN